MNRSLYARDGYIVCDAFDTRVLHSFEERIRERARRLGKDFGDVDTETGLARLEQRDPGTFLDLCTGVGTSLDGLELTVAPELRRQLEALAPRGAGALYPQPPGLFMNSREAPRLHYDWHQEHHYYPGAPWSVHVWFPLFRDLTSQDGPMEIIPGSHSRAWPRVREHVAGGLTQMRTDLSKLSSRETFSCTLRRGQAVLFHPLMVHRTAPLRTDQPRLSGVIRFFHMDEAPRAPLPTALNARFTRHWWRP